LSLTEIEEHERELSSSSEEYFVEAAASGKDAYEVERHRLRSEMEDKDNMVAMLEKEIATTR